MAGQYTPQLSDVSLAELLHDVMLHFNSLAQRKRVDAGGASPPKATSCRMDTCCAASSSTSWPMP